MDARLLERRQTPDGSWNYVVAVEVPADVVQPIQGESYDLVPTWRPWILHAPWMGRPGILHAAGCPSAGGPRGIGLRGLTTPQARQVLAAEPDTIRCELCRPEP
ncbi:DUF6233 domain-containing protein [Actinacidiphila sp. DG2A-62]|uniref:DUF6233 domain-containing protein n=1 Tax=Actinacidiphila sp. DG2A-62 TaxID=3108821 RepID=UPI002DBABFED|nr:DUF6233 domain-containing protein [Actinacidiphila sp. DG2A-62]MEC3994031.1 DUF6233 domain-containing protein [Actinacidiphila sp. DG2A-62]